MPDCPDDFCVLAVGDLSREEFGDAIHWLHQHAQVTTAASMGSAADTLRSASQPPTIVVLGQSFPGQFSSDQVEQIRRLSPLTPVVSLLGSWCEGETRTGHPSAGTTRVYWHHWIPRTDTDRTRVAAGQCPLWGLPPTVTEDERWLNRSRVPLALRQGLIAVRADQYETALALMDACHQSGYSAVWLRPGSPPAFQGAAACLWDVKSFGPSALATAGSLVRLLGEIPLVAVVGFPRTQDCRQLLGVGVAAVISKPYLIGDLLWQLDRVTRFGPRRRAPPCVATSLARGPSGRLGS